MTTSKSNLLRKFLSENNYLFTTGIATALDARLVERAGLQVAYMSGYSTSLILLGRADLGFLTMTEMARNAAYITSATTLPLISDADDGYGNALNVMRTVEEFEKAGVAGIHIEDQEAPKRCGHLPGKIVIPLEEAVGKLRAAVKAKQDPDFLIIARTDARMAVGGGLDEALRRARAYAQTGVDMLWCEFASPDAVDEFERFAVEVHKERPGMPLVFNYSSSQGWCASKHRLTFKELGQMGYRLIIVSMGTIHASMKGTWDFLKDLRDHQEQAQFRLEKSLQGHPTEDHHAVGDVSYYKELEKEFLPQDLVRERYKNPDQ